MRLETGVVQCGVDWPGVFIRGDDALALARALRHVLVALPGNADIYTKLSASQVDGLVKLLLRSSVRADGHVVDQIVHLSDIAPSTDAKER